MKPFSYFELLRKMPRKADKYDLRLKMVNNAIENGVKPTARLFATTPKTVRKWLNRYKQERLAGLNELPRIPLHCPHKTSPSPERKIVELRKRFPFMGSARLKREHNLPCSHTAVDRILREHDLVRKRRKKHKRKKDLAKIKMQNDRLDDAYCGAIIIHTDPSESTQRAGLPVPRKLNNRPPPYMDSYTDKFQEKAIFGQERIE